MKWGLVLALGCLAFAILSVRTVELNGENSSLLLSGMSHSRMGKWRALLIAALKKYQLGIEMKRILDVLFVQLTSAFRSKIYFVTRNSGICRATIYTYGRVEYRNLKSLTMFCSEYY